MIAITSASLLKEFTCIAERANDEKETFIIQRANHKDVVLMSLDAFNEIQKKLFLAGKK
jgi:antitoxin YefM